MAVDRDLAVAVLRAWSELRGRTLEAWDALAATGVRGLRLLNETKAFRAMVLSEVQPQSLLVLRENARPWAELGACVTEHDARNRLRAEPFDYVDVDPFGTPVPFLPAAFESLRVGGILGVAATDMPVLAGVQRGAAERRYGGVPVRGRLGPEGGLRLLLAHVSRIAAARVLQIRPLVSYVLDHHVRAYVEVVPAGEAPTPVDSIQAESWSGPRLGPRSEYGPLWTGPLFLPEVVEPLRLPATSHRPRETATLIARIQQEASVAAPFYYEPNVLAQQLRLSEPPGPDRMVEALRAQGWRAARTHARPSGVRTDAPRVEVERCIRALASETRKNR